MLQRIVLMQNELNSYGIVKMLVSVVSTTGSPDVVLEAMHVCNAVLIGGNGLVSLCAGHATWYHRGCVTYLSLVFTHCAQVQRSFLREIRRPSADFMRVLFERLTSASLLWRQQAKEVGSIMSHSAFILLLLVLGTVTLPATISSRVESGVVRVCFSANTRLSTSLRATR